MRALVGVVVCVVLAGCAGAPKVAYPDRSGVWGYLRLVPREGVAGRGSAGAATPYADRRYSDAELVDYTRPGFAVVYLEGPVPTAPPLTLSIRSGLSGVELVPRSAALPVGAEIVVRNASSEARVLTCPAAGLVRRLAPGERVAFAAPREGPVEIFVPGPTASQSGRAQIFAAPGPYARVDGVGRYEIVDVDAGRRRLHAWHPRFPPAVRDVDLEPGGVARIDLELGVGLDDGRSDAD